MMGLDRARLAVRATNNPEPILQGSFDDVKAADTTIFGFSL
jgi:hypothetical protein